MPKKLGSEDTIATVLPGLSHPRDYLAGVRHKMLTCKKAHGNSHVCIGITGSGQKPCYRITYRDAAGAEAIYGSYWDMHDALDNENAMNGHWSCAVMDFDAIDQLMRDRFSTPLTRRTSERADRT